MWTFGFFQLLNSAILVENSNGKYETSSNKIVFTKLGDISNIGSRWYKLTLPCSYLINTTKCYGNNSTHNDKSILKTGKKKDRLGI